MSLNDKVKDDKKGKNNKKSMKLNHTTKSFEIIFFQRVSCP